MNSTQTQEETMFQEHENVWCLRVPPTLRFGPWLKIHALCNVTGDPCYVYCAWRYTGSCPGISMTCALHLDIRNYEHGKRYMLFCMRCGNVMRAWLWHWWWFHAPCGISPVVHAWAQRHWGNRPVSTGRAATSLPYSLTRFTPEYICYCSYDIHYAL